jgi:hypothetical protein
VPASGENTGIAAGAARLVPERGMTRVPPTASFAIESEPVYRSGNLLEVGKPQISCKSFPHSMRPHSSNYLTSSQSRPSGLLRQ